MSANRRILIVDCPATLLLHFDGCEASGFLISVVNDRCVILQEETIPFFGDEEETVIFFKRKWKGRFEQMLVSSQTAEDFKIALQAFSSRFNFLVFQIGRQRSFSGGIHYGQTVLSERALGEDNPLPLLSDAQSSQNIARWLTFPIDLSVLQNFLGNKSLYPASLSDSKKAQEINLALMTEVLRVLARDLVRSREESPFEIAGIGRIIVSGRSFFGVHQAAALLSFLNSFETNGVYQLLLDERGLFMPLGKLLTFSGTGDLPFINLGTVLIFNHHHKEGEVISRLSFDLGLVERLKVVLRAETLIKIPLALGAEGSLEIDLEKGVSLGLQETIKIQGGSLGLILDARCRPLIKPLLNTESRQKTAEWLQQLTV